MDEFYIGLMSGTSLDGVDGVLAAFPSSASASSLDTTPRLRVVAFSSSPFDAAFRAELLALNAPSPNELHRAALAGNRLADAYASVVHSLLGQARQSGIDGKQITAIGAHGQTVRHQPPTGASSDPSLAYTLQLINSSRLAELTGLSVVADFRSRDVAAGGQGAPLAPAFHQYLFARPDEAVAVLNLGGISNLTLLPPTSCGAAVIGFDCGTGNALMDAWCQRHTGQPYDDGGAWAASGALIPALLASLLADAYFSKDPPKSTGRDLFSAEWLEAKLQPFSSQKPQDVQRTLAEFTVQPCLLGVSSYGKGSRQLIICGGGAFNTHVVERLRAGLPGVRVASSADHGLPPLQVEAAAFAWLARQTINGKPGNLPSVTGSAGPRVLGAIYPA